MTVRPEIGDGWIGIEIPGESVFLRRSEIGEWVDERFWSAFDVWWTWRTLGTLPFAGGWAEQPVHLKVIIEEAEVAYKAAVAQEQEKNRGSSR